MVPGSMFQNLMTGQQSTADSLFGRLTGGGPSPDAHELEEGRLRAQFDKLVRYQDFGVETFDLSDRKQVAAYKKLMTVLFKGVQAHTHVILMNDRRFVETPEAHWVTHVEWLEFDVETVAHAPVGT